MGHYFSSKNKGKKATLPKSKKAPPLYNKEDVTIRYGKPATLGHHFRDSYSTSVIHQVPVTVLSSGEVRGRKRKRKRRVGKKGRGKGGGRGEGRGKEGGRNGKIDLFNPALELGK